jgi:hypothetical protein
MSGFEVVVRPVILPNIRPPRAQVLPPEDNPEQGLMVINGSRTSIGASESWTMNVTKQKPQQEETRQFDKERVYQKDDKGKINKSVFVDIERLKKVRLSATGGPIKQLYADPPSRDNVEILESNQSRDAT